MAVLLLFRIETALWVHAAKKASKWYREILEDAERVMTARGT